MFSEPSERHHVPHFHAYYQENAAVFSISPVELVTGTMPQRQQRLIEAWAAPGGVAGRLEFASGRKTTCAHRSFALNYSTCSIRFIG
jgi:hypothetical protein